MPTMEYVLATKTHKQDGLDLERRVFYTLIGDPNSPNPASVQADRNSKAIALLFQSLRKRGLLSDAEIDQILLEVVS